MEHEPGAIDCEASGTGPAIVLVPGSCSTGAAWRPIIARLAANFTCVTTSLLGYGGTAERRSQTDLSISHECDIIEAVIERFAPPVHLVGHSFGGLVSLAVALRRRVSLASLVVLEAPAMAILASSGEPEHYAAFRSMNDTYFAAVTDGDRDAIATMIDFYGGAGVFDTWPERLRTYARATTPVNILDWRSAYGFPLSADMLAELAVPTLVVCGGVSHPSVRRANELVRAAIPRSCWATIEGAAHFMIATHPDEVAALLSQHVTAAQGASQFQPIGARDVIDAGLDGPAPAPATIPDTL